ncbi:hypothetical protein ACJZ2D_007574 [Fusarium nematophilum]
MCRDSICYYYCPSEGCGYEVADRGPPVTCPYYRRNAAAACPARGTYPDLTLLAIDKCPECQNAASHAKTQQSSISADSEESSSPATRSATPGFSKHADFPAEAD